MARAGLRPGLFDVFSRSGATRAGGRWGVVAGVSVAALALAALPATAATLPPAASTASATASAGDPAGVAGQGAVAGDPTWGGTAGGSLLAGVVSDVTSRPVGLTGAGPALGQVAQAAVAIGGLPGPAIGWSMGQHVFTRTSSATSYASWWTVDSDPVAAGAGVSVQLTDQLQVCTSDSGYSTIIGTQAFYSDGYATVPWIYSRYVGPYGYNDLCSTPSVGTNAIPTTHGSTGVLTRIEAFDQGHVACRYPTAYQCFTWYPKWSAQRPTTYDAGAGTPIVAPAGGPMGVRENPGTGNVCLTCLGLGASRVALADPVDTAAGAFAESSVDLAISGRGPQGIWARSYTSAMAGDDGPLGFGWHAGYGAHLVIDPGTGDVTVSQENGSETVFTLAGGVFSAPPRVQATLVKNPDGTYTLVRQASQTLRFTATGVLTSIADRNGETTTLAYAGGNLATITEPGGRALSVTFTGTHITKVTDPLGQAASYTYDGSGNLATVTGPDGAVTTFGYDAAHHVTSVLDPAQSSAPVTHPMTMVYDTQGRVTSQSDPLGRTTTFAYTGDPFSSIGGATLTTDPAGHLRTDVYFYGVRAGSITGYGTAFAVTSTFTFDPATLGVTSTSITSANDPVTHTSTATYDAHGLPLTQVDGLGREVDTTYNSFGEALTVTAPNPSTVGPARVTTTSTYDAKGNVLSVTRPLYTSATAFTNQVTTYRRATVAHPQDVTGVVDPLGNTTVNTYTATGALASSTSPQGRKTTSTYDSIGRRLTSVVPKGNVTGANAAQFTTTNTYDGAGRVLSTSVATTSSPLVSSQTYDLDGRVVTQTDGLGQVTTNAYDLAGEPVLVTRPDGSTRASTYWPDGALKTQVDGNTNTTSYTEDVLGRVASVTDALGRATTYTRDATGAVLTVTDPQNQVTTNTYDAAGELTSTTYSDGVTHSAVRTYNAAGLPATLVDGTGTTTFTYDSLGRLTNQAAPGGTVGYGYNLRGQVTTLTYPNAKVVTRAYEADGAMTSSTDWSSKKTTFSYDQNEAWTSEAAANAVTTTTGYDNPGRAVSTTITKGTTTLGSLTYTDDAASQITQETSVSLGATRTFTLDTTGRVTTENTSVYAYDAADQLTTNGATTQGYDAGGQLTTAVTGSTSTAYTFDARGNRTKATTGAAVATYAYDQANRLTGYTRGTTTATYAYNGDGLRASKTVGGVTTKFVYDTAEGMPLILTDGASYYLYGPGGIPYAQITTAGVTTYLHADQLGSIRMITTATGTSAGTATYTAHGTRTTTGTTSPFGYAGQYTDTETGLQWLRARYYDPTTAQFLTVDPLAAITGARYSYAGCNPITGADPTGLRETPLGGGGGGVGGGGFGGVPVEQAGTAADVEQWLKRLAGCPDTEAGASTGWKAGDSITALTRAGNEPAWSTVRGRYWKNAADAALDGEFSSSNLSRMARGLAPLNDDFGVSMELNHVVPRYMGGGHEITNLEPLWPWEHAAVDAHRFYTGPRP
jgi:RHS repeat-associated protein